MEWLNYHHLLYFWVVAREGSIAKATRELRLAQPTISGQIRTLEEQLGEKLFQRQGRNLVLTEVGGVVYRYAEEIFTLGRELLDTVKGRPSGRPVRFVVGVAEVVPKLVAYRLLESALALPESVRIVCLEDRTDRLLAELSVHALDLVITDVPIGPHVKVRAYNHLLGECGVSFFAPPKLAAALRRSFPHSLDGAPMLVPSDNTTLRRSLDQWLELESLRPRIVAEFEDSALMKVFAQAGHGAFAGPTAIEREICAQYGVRTIGRTDAIRERFYAISVERRVKHPAVLAITEAARSRVFG
ncbi:MAG TPA: transcriptional activator NhaR [Myxococcota bacterium]|nr:transcriptional activator NhaR [Myxococcota bacterium]